MQTEADVIFGRIVKAWRKYTNQTCNLNLFFGFQKGNVTDPDVSCTIVIYAYPNHFRGTMTHYRSGEPLPEPITDEWYVLRHAKMVRPGDEAPQYVTGWGNDINEAMLDAERKMHDRFATTQPKETP